MLKDNYASVGLTLQKLICDNYNIIPATNKVNILVLNENEL